MSENEDRRASDAQGQAGGRSAGAHERSLAVGPVMGLLFALGAGGVMWAFLQVGYPAFAVPAELDTLPPTAPQEKHEEHEAAQKKVNCYNPVLALGVFGALLGGALGFSEGVCRRSLKTALAATVACMIPAALLGGLAGLLGHVTSLRTGPLGDLTPLVRTIYVQAITLGVLGGGVGLGLGLIAKRFPTLVLCPLGGLLAGVLAGMLYPMLAAVLLPFADTDPVVPYGVGLRLLWIGLAAGLLGLSIPRAARRRRDETKRS